MINAKKRYINSIIRVGIFVLFGCLFFSWSVFATTMVINVWDTVNYNWVNIVCDSNANCTSTIWDNSFLGLAQDTNITAESQVLFRNIDKTIGYLKWNTRGAGSVWQRYINSWCPVDYSVGTTYTNYVTDYMNGCTNNTWNYQARTENASLYAWKLTSLTFNTFWGQGLICRNYNEDLGSFCIQFQYNQNSIATDYWITFPVTIEKINTVATNSPFVWGGGWDSWGSWTLIPTNSDVDKVINYYETRFNWNEDMCYVWTNDLTSVYWSSWVDFNSWTWDTIFWLYYSLYNSYWNSIINNVWKFVNVRTLNYWQWFYEWDNIKWLATDNWPDNNVSYIYTWFTFPFANKPVAIYFMASNLYDWYTRESSQWVDMAFYCYSKLNYDNINDWTINYEEVKEQVSENILGRIDTYVNYHINPNTNNSQYQIPTSWSFWDSFGTWYEDTDIELDTTFSDFYMRITNIFQNYSPLYSTWIIPDYILYALIFLILFRIMKH